MRATVDIGASGIDVVAAGGALWVPSRSAAVDQTGFPTMEALRRVTPDGDGRATVASRAAASTSTGSPPTTRTCGSRDNTAGIVYRIPLTG